jgi:phosphoglycerate dehydrogenase-like enzyme
MERLYIAIPPDVAAEIRLDAALHPLRGRLVIDAWHGPGRPDQAAMAVAAADATIIVTGWGTPPLAMLRDWHPDQSPLRLVAHTAGTIKALVPRAALERGLAVTTANLSLAEAVAEFTVGLMITARRNLFMVMRRAARGGAAVPLASQRELRGCTVGIIGASAIGRRVLHLLRALGVRCLLADPFCDAVTAHALGAELCGLDALLGRCEIVSLHAPITPATIGMLGAAQFARMRDGALFINTARGVLIDHDALLAELRRGRLLAVLDVTDPVEPLPPDSPFLQLEHCVVLPHMAAVTQEARERQGAMAVAEIGRWLAGEPLAWQVVPAHWDQMA